MVSRLKGLGVSAKAPELAVEKKGILEPETKSSEKKSEMRETLRTVLGFSKFESVRILC